MHSIVRFSLFGAVCFLAGTLTVASRPFTPHVGDDDLPIDGTSCTATAHACDLNVQTVLTHSGAIPKPMVLRDKCTAYDTSKDTNQFRPSEKVTHLINIAGKSAYGFSTTPSATKATVGKKNSRDVTVPYVFVVVDHCVQFDDPEHTKQITTQIIRVPSRAGEDPTVETIRTTPK